MSEPQAIAPMPRFQGFMAMDGHIPQPFEFAKKYARVQDRYR